MNNASVAMQQARVILARHSVTDVEIQHHQLGLERLQVYVLRGLVNKTIDKVYEDGRQRLFSLMNAQGAE